MPETRQVFTDDVSNAPLASIIDGNTTALIKHAPLSSVIDDKTPEIRSAFTEDVSNAPLASIIDGDTTALIKHAPLSSVIDDKTPEIRSAFTDDVSNAHFTSIIDDETFLSPNEQQQHSVLNLVNDSSRIQKNESEVIFHAHFKFNLKNSVPYIVYRFLKEQKIVELIQSSSDPLIFSGVSTLPEAFFNTGFSYEVILGDLRIESRNSLPHCHVCYDLSNRGKLLSTFAVRESIKFWLEFELRTFLKGKTENFSLTNLWLKVVCLMKRNLQDCSTGEIESIFDKLEFEDLGSYPEKLHFMSAVAMLVLGALSTYHTVLASRRPYQKFITENLDPHKIFKFIEMVNPSDSSHTSSLMSWGIAQVYSGASILAKSISLISYDWIRMLPFTLCHSWYSKPNPRINCEEAFGAGFYELASRSIELVDRYSSKISSNRPDTNDLRMRSLLMQAPNIDMLHFLCTNKRLLSISSEEEVAKVVIKRISCIRAVPSNTIPWSDEACTKFYFDLHHLLESFSGLSGTDILLATLGNSYIDPPYSKEGHRAVLNFIQSFNKKKSDKDNAVQHIYVMEESKSSELSLCLSNWFCRCHNPVASLFADNSEKGVSELLSMGKKAFSEGKKIVQEKFKAISNLLSRNPIMHSSDDDVISRKKYCSWAIDEAQELQDWIDEQQKHLSSKAVDEMKLDIYLALQKCWFFQSNDIMSSKKIVESVCLVLERGFLNQSMTQWLHSIVIQESFNILPDGRNLIINMVIEKMVPNSTLAGSLVAITLVLPTAQNQVQISDIDFFFKDGDSLICLSKLLEDVALWTLVFKWANKSDQVEKCKVLDAIFTSVSTIMLKLYEQISSKSVSISKLDLLFQDSKGFFHLLEVLYGTQAIDINMLETCRLKIDWFHRSLVEFNCFISRYCGGSLLIDIADMKEHVQEIESKRSSGALCLQDIDDAAVKIMAVPNLSWLYSLRDSNLLQVLWVSKGMLLFATGESDDIIDGDFKDDKVVATNNVFSDLSPISMDDIYSMLIPSVRNEWHTTGSDIIFGRITLENFDRLLCQLPFHCQDAEMRNLAESLRAEKIFSTEWDMNHKSWLKCHRRLVGLQKWLPALEKLLDRLDSICSKKNDDYRNKLSNANKQIKNILSQKLCDAPAQLLDIEPKFLRDISEAHFEVVVALAYSTDELLPWLIKNSSTVEVLRLLQICICTDDVHVLRSIASLKIVLGDLRLVLFPNPIHTGLKDLLAAIVTVNVSLDHISNRIPICMQIETLNASFNTLLKAINSQTQSDGVRALQMLQSFSKNFCFSVSTTGISLGPIYSANATSALNDTSLIHQNELFNLQAKLAMLEVSPELDSKFNAIANREAFDSQLQLLVEAHDAVLGLKAAGHFDYQNDSAVLSWNYSSLAHKVGDLKGKVESLKGQERAWQKILTDCRRNYPLLNFFTIRDLLNLLISLRCKDDERSAAIFRILIGKNLVSFAKMVRNQWACSTNSEMLWLAAIGLAISNAFENFTFSYRKIEPLQINSPKFNDILKDYTAGLIGKNVVPRRVKQNLVVCVTCADSEETVLSVVLSTYIRRGYLPEAGNLLICSDHTCREEIELMVMRSAFATPLLKANKYYDVGVEEQKSDPVACALTNTRQDSNSLFCISDVHKLSYADQVWMVELIRRVMFWDEVDSPSAILIESLPLLLIVSGVPKQALIGLLSAYYIDIPPLPLKDLQDVCSPVLIRSFGEKSCVIMSEISGGGKSHYAMRLSAEWQQESEGKLWNYHRIALRKSSEVKELIIDLNAAHCSDNYPSVIHLDIAHVIPSNACTILFQLIVLGFLKDASSGATYSRPENCALIIEIPNTPGNIVAAALTPAISLLPLIFLKVSADSLDMRRPVPRENGSFRIDLFDDSELQFTCKWLLEMSRAKIANNLNSSYTACTAKNVDNVQCFSLLKEHCCMVGGLSPKPSWGLFRVFITHVHSQLQSVESYPLLSSAALDGMSGLETFRFTFVQLLLRTAEMFTARSISQDATTYVSSFDPFAKTDSVTHNSDRETATNCVNRLAEMKTWGNRHHPLVLFKTYVHPTYGTSEVLGVDILSLCPEFLSQHINGHLHQALTLNRINFQRDWKNLSTNEAIDLLRGVEGLPLLDVKSNTNIIDPGYVLTIDTLLKMLALQMRVHCGSTIVISGETGVGKTAVLRNLCSILGWNLHVLCMHGGITDAHIVSWMKERVAACSANQVQGNMTRVIILLDELNACNSVALCKEIVCDRRLVGELLPSRMCIVGACNPYRLRTRFNEGDIQGVGLEFDDIRSKNSGIVDPLKDLVYRVHPLPESMINHLYDFGALSSTAEKRYIASMVNRYLCGKVFHSSTIDTQWCTAFSNLLCAAQEGVRHSVSERSAVSLRDVDRCLKVFTWFISHPQLFRESTNKFEDESRRCAILSLCFCYFARLGRHSRSALIGQIAMVSEQTRGCLRVSKKQIFQIIRESQEYLVGLFDIGDGIAPNEALRENIFMLLVAVQNGIPIFLVGKPGSSKSLAVEILQQNLRGNYSDNEILRTLPSLALFTYQCSPLSTSSGIEAVFNSARAYHKEAENSVSVVLLDEVALAELSPNLPLKVLHNMMDDAGPGESMIGLSNWALDPAKMNRAVYVQRPAPTVEDLSNTAENMVNASPALKPTLKNIARAYEKVYAEQTLAEFWGLRDFYSTVRSVSGKLSASDTSNTELKNLKADILLEAVQCNFGGRPLEETGKAAEIFMKELYGSLQSDQPSRSRSTRTGHTSGLSAEAYIRNNLNGSCGGINRVRHMMLLGQSTAMLSLLDNRGLLNQRPYEVLFGSSFHKDIGHMWICRALQRVCDCMAKGKVLVIIHGDALYESLYDVLNQHYHEVGGKLYARVAFGAQSRVCVLSEQFRMIVLVETHDAWNKLNAPLLNRFEKHIYGARQVLSPVDVKHLSSMEKMTKHISSAVVNQGTSSNKVVFCCKGEPTLPSLILVVREELNALANMFSLNTSKIEHELIMRCMRKLLWIATPESICCLMFMVQGITKSTALESALYESLPTYFSNVQGHEDAPGALMAMSVNKTGDNAELDAVIMTHAPLMASTQLLAKQFKDILKLGFDGLETSLNNARIFPIALHQFSREAELSHEVHSFFASSVKSSEQDEVRILVVQIDVAANPLQTLQQTMYLVNCERKSGHSREFKAVVCLLLHVPRSSDLNQFNVVFDKHWQFAFADDCIRSMDCVDAIDAWSMVRECCTVQNVSNDYYGNIFDMVNLQLVLARCTRAALSFVQLPENTSTSEGIRKNIEILIQVIENTDCQFSNSIKDIIINTYDHAAREGLQVPPDFVLNPKEYLKNSIKNETLLRNDTLQHALYTTILQSFGKLFAIILSHCARTGGLNLIHNLIFAPSIELSASMTLSASDRQTMVKIWFSLLEESFSSMERFSNLLNNFMESSGSRIQAICDSFDGQQSFDALFPFSFYVSRTLDTLLFSANLTTYEGLHSFEASLHNQLCYSPHLKSIVRYLELPCKPILVCYLFDLICLKLPPLQDMDRIQQAELVWLMLKLPSNEEDSRSSEFPSTIAGLHGRFTVLLPYITQYFSLISCVGSACYKIIFDVFSEDTLNIAGTLLLTRVAKQLMPSKSLWTSLDSIRNWHETVRAAHNIVLNILCKAGEFDMIPSVIQDYTPVREIWEVLLLIERFVAIIIIPLKISVSVGLHCANKLATENSIKSSNTFKEVKEVLGILLKLKSAEISQPSERFFQHYLFDAVFHSGLKNLQAEFIFELARFLAQTCDLEAGTFPFNAQSGLMSCFFDLIQSGKQTNDNFAVMGLSQVLAQSASAMGGFDTPLCTTYVLIGEDKFKLDADFFGDISKVSIMSQEVASHVFLGMKDFQESSDKLEFTMTLLRSTIYARKLLDHLAVEIYESVNGINCSAYQLLQYLDAMQPLLLMQANSSQDRVETLKNIQMYLFRKLEKERGLTSVRRALCSSAIRNSYLVTQWNDFEMVKFLGNSRLPKGNPFKEMIFFNEVHAIVSSIIAGSKNIDVKQVIKDLCSRMTQLNLSSNRLYGTFVAAIFCEITLQCALGQDELVASFRNGAQKVHKLLNLHLSNVIKVPRECALVLLWAQCSNTSTFLNSSSDIDSILRERVVAHFVGSVFQAAENDILSIYKKAMIDPQKLLYLPSMPAGFGIELVQKISGLALYRCPKGHPYAIGDCGRPWVTASCPECQAQIGGTSHNSIAGNVQLVELLPHELPQPGYCLPFQTPTIALGVRALRVHEHLTVRFLLNTALSLGALSGGKRWVTEAIRGGLFKHADGDIAHLSYLEISQAFKDRSVEDWNSLKTALGVSSDDLATRIHTILKRYTGFESSSILGSDAERNAWETLFQEQFLTDNALCASNITDIDQTDDSDDNLTREILAGNSNPYSRWKLSRNNDNILERIKQEVALLSLKDVLKLPVLSLLFSVDPTSGYAGLQYLPAALRWIDKVTRMNDYRLRREEAREMNVGAFIQQYNGPERTSLEADFEQFSSAWNCSWREVDGIDCIKIPAQFKDIIMGKDTPLSFCLPGDKDEGICPLALLQYLVNLHNQVVFAACKSTKIREMPADTSNDAINNAARDSQDSTTITSSIMSQFHSVHHALITGSSIVSYVQKHCDDNLFRIEQRIVHVDLSGVRALKLEIKKFTYALEGESTLTELARKIPQQSLPNQLKMALDNDIKSRSAASAVLSTIDLVANFLAQTGGTLVVDGDKSKEAHTSLAEYLENVLLLDPSAVLKCPLLVKEGQLSHISDLREILQKKCDDDPFSLVNLRYRKPLETAWETSIMNATKRKFTQEAGGSIEEECLNLKVLMPAMKQFITRHLVDSVSQISEKTSIKDSLKYWPVNGETLEDQSWFDKWPDDVLMSSVLEAYKLLERISKGSE